ncbi:hypothetical protein E0K83_16225 [Gramella sp. BOM4]|nr:hypothetical protein [Christiangramia bathymodioli]
MKLQFVCLFIASIISASSLAQSNGEHSEPTLEDDLEVVDSLIVKGALDKAIENALELNDTYPKNLKIIQSLIFSYTGLGMTEQVRYWLKEKEKNHDDINQSYLYTYLPLIERDYQRAKIQLDIFTKTADSSNPDVWYKAVPLAFHLGDYEEVIYCTEKVMTFMPERKNLTALYAFALMQIGEKARARKILSDHKEEMENNLIEDRNDYDAHLNLAKIAAIESDSERAVYHLDNYMGDFIPDFIHYFLIDEPAYTFWDNIRNEAPYQTFFKNKENRIEEMKGNLMTSN